MRRRKKDEEECHGSGSEPEGSDHLKGRRQADRVWFVRSGLP